MRFLNKNKIKLDKIPTNLDKFVFRFVKILEKHVKYVIVSGYVSIVFGRARATEDVDVLIEKIDKKKFVSLYKNLVKHGYWCLNSKSVNEAFDMLSEKLGVRFSLKRNIIPNFELKFAKNRLEKDTIQNPLKVVSSLGELNISTIEQQIAFKELVLKSDKDLEDAKHLEVVFKDKIDKNKLNKYRRMFK